MDTKVVTVARALGAGGETIARAIAAELGFRYVDEEIVSAAAARENLDPAIISDAERRKPLLARLLEAFSAGPTLEATALGGMMSDPALYFPHGFEGASHPAVSVPEHYRELIRQAIVETATAGRVVIHAHAAGMALAGMADLLRVLVTASPAIRAQRLADQSGVSLKEAEKQVAHSDRDRRDYFKRFHGVTDETPTDYDVVINTDVLSLESAVGVILAAARPGGVSR